MDRELNKYLPGQEREPLLQNVCNGKLKGNDNDRYKLGEGYKQPSCHFLHHFNKYNILGPFNIEVKYYYPMRILFHDFLFDEEMEWMQEISRAPLKSTMHWLISNNNSSIEQVANRDIRVLLDGRGKVFKVLPSYNIDDIIYEDNDNSAKNGIDSVIKNHITKSVPVVNPVNYLKDPYRFLIEHTLLFRI